MTDQATGTPDGSEGTPRREDVPSPNGSPPLLTTTGLTRHFRIGGGLSRRTLHAVDDVSLAIGEREIVALAGESGSGKSTIARLLAKVYKPTSGEIYFQGTPLSSIRSRRETLRYTGLVPMVFQDPFSSINPVVPGLARHPARAQAAPARAQRGPAPAGSGARLRDRRPDPGGRGAQALPARAERRSAAAGGLRPGAGAAAEADPGRRAGLHAGRVDPDRAAQPDGRAARCRRRVDPVHHPRHRQRALRGRPADRDVCRAHRRVRARRGRAGPPEASLHPAAPVGGARPPGPARRHGGYRPGRAAARRRSRPGLQVPLALPARHRHMPPGDAGTQRTFSPATTWPATSLRRART